MTGSEAPAKTGLSRQLLTVLIAAAAICLGVMTGLSTRGAFWEGWAIDRQFQIRALLNRADAPKDQPVAVVGLDRVALASDSLASIPRVFMTPLLAQAGQAVLDAGAKAVGFDFVFAFSADAFADPETGDALLRGYDRPFLAFLYKNRDRVFVARTSTGNPHRAISAAAGSAGVRLAEVTPDNDGVVRRHAPRMPLETSPLLLDALLSRSELASSGGSLPKAYTAVPEARLASSLPYLSFLDVLDLTKSAEGKEALKAFSENRIVLFGSTMPNEDEHLYSDRFLPILPLSEAETGESGRPPVRHATAGVYVLADLIGAPLSGRAAVDPPYFYTLVAAAGFAVAGALAALTLPLTVLPVVLASGLLGTIVLGQVGLQAGVLFAPAVSPVAFVVAMLVSAVGKVGLLQRRQRALVRLFGHYLAPDVIKEMANSEQLPSLGGETREVVVMFIDIVGFTKMSEKLADHQVVAVVNTCFEEIGRVITRHQGYIDKYIGDAVMAVWNAPNRVDAPEIAAVSAADDIIDLLSALRATTGQPELDLRIAVHNGPVLVGDIGGEHRRSFTVMGTTVNTASRIEGVAKDTGVRIALSHTVAENLHENMPLRQIWKGQLRGLSTDMAVYTLDKDKVLMTSGAEPPQLAMVGKV